MTENSARTIETARHPWLAAFCADPDKEFADFLRGYADVAPFGRADTPDAAVQLFGSLPADDVALKRLETAVIEWIKRRQSKPLPETLGKRRREIGEVCDVFQIVSQLNLVSAAAHFFQHRVKLAHWLASFREGDDRDARMRFFQTLATMQPALSDEGLKVDSLAPLWLDLCRGAGRLVPSSYLDVGLLGFRKIPKPYDQSDISGWLTGLVHWALYGGASEIDFTRKWRALKYLYPRTPKIWRAEVGRLVAQPKIKSALENAERDVWAWWTKDVDLAPLAKPNAVFADAARCPTIDDCEAIERGIANNLAETMEHRLLPFVAGHLRFARITGIDEFLVIAFHRVGKALVGSRDHEAARAAIDLALESMRWRPVASRSWSLWADALEALGLLEACEVVRREKLRLLPFDADSYTQLAEFLIASGQADEALLTVEEAETLDVANAVVGAIKVRLVCHFSGADAAKLVLEDFQQRFPDHPTWPPYEDALQTRGVLKLISIHYRDFPLVPAEGRYPSHPSVEPYFQTSRLAKLDLELRNASGNGAAAEKLRAILKIEPELAYAKLLASRYGLWTSRDDAMPGFAVAFEQALKDGDLAMLDRLASSMPRLRALTMVAKAIFGSVEAAEEIETWLRMRGADYDVVRLEEFRQWLIDKWEAARSKSAGNVVSFAEFAAWNRDMILAGTRRAHEMVSVGMLLAA